MLCFVGFLCYTYTNIAMHLIISGLDLVNAVEIGKMEKSDYQNPELNQGIKPKWYRTQKKKRQAPGQ